MNGDSPELKQTTESLMWRVNAPVFIPFISFKMKYVSFIVIFVLLGLCFSLTTAKAKKDCSPCVSALSKLYAVFHVSALKAEVAVLAKEVCAHFDKADESCNAFADDLISV